MKSLVALLVSDLVEALRSTPAAIGPSGAYWRGDTAAAFVRITVADLSIRAGSATDDAALLAGRATRPTIFRIV